MKGWEVLISWGTISSSKKDNVSLNKSTHQDIKPICQISRRSVSLRSFFPGHKYEMYLFYIPDRMDFGCWIAMCMLWSYVICEFWCTIASQILSIGVVFPRHSLQSQMQLMWIETCAWYGVHVTNIVTCGGSTGMGREWKRCFNRLG
jgi:hypothetical protein